VRSGREVAVRCVCDTEADRGRLLASARIPARYLHCTLESFDENWDPGTPVFPIAKRRTQEFVDCFPAVKKGLLYIGRTGIGKTHLAVAALRELVLVKRVRGMYSNFIDLVQELQLSFDGAGRNREEILRPVVAADLVVLDELGAGKLTPWVSDLMYYVVNSRYMANRITLVTSNYLDVRRTPGDENLEDRISVALRSRLYEMCDTIDMAAERDYRRHMADRRGSR